MSIVWLVFFVFFLSLSWLNLTYTGSRRFFNIDAAKNKKVSCKRTAFNRRTINYKAWKEQMTVCELLENYDPAVRPFGKSSSQVEKNGPVIVTTRLFIQSISAVNERNMEYVAQFRFYQEWFDDRLQFERLSEFRNFDYINVARDQNLWIPDSFFQNERNGHYHMLDQENRFVRVRFDGKVIYNRRLTLTLACNMNLLKYPMDVQECLIDFASYAYTTNDIIYQWDELGIDLAPTAKGALPNFEISKLRNETCHSTTNTGSYSCLRVHLTLRRVFSFFLLQLYIPSAMLVGVSWVSYWIDWKSTAARVPLAIVTLLTMITTSHAINSNLPPVSYAKSIDIWVGGCVVFIFASLIEYAIVNYMGILDEHRQMRKITLNCTRLTNILDNRISFSSGGLSSLPIISKIKNFTNPSSNDNSRATNNILQKRRKLQLNLQYEVVKNGNEQNPSSKNMDPTSVYVPFHQLEPDRTMEDFNDLVYVGQRKRVELVRWCNLLSERGRAERIDIIARIIFPVAFTLFNFAYWSIYLGEDERNPTVAVNL